jgi:hypothetical protein
MPALIAGVNTWLKRVRCGTRAIAATEHTPERQYEPARKTSAADFVR